MRIIKESFLKAVAVKHPRAKDGIERWIEMVRAAAWKNPVEMQQTVADVDPVRVKSGHTVYVFNIRRNEFRLIAAIHFDRQRAFTLRFFTHTDYEKTHWKDEL